VIFDKAYCLTRAEYHDRQSEEAKKDAKVIAADPAHGLQSEHFEMFNKLHKQHSSFARAWREQARRME